MVLQGADGQFCCFTRYPARYLTSYFRGNGQWSLIVCTYIILVSFLALLFGRCPCCHSYDRQHLSVILHTVLLASAPFANKGGHHFAVAFQIQSQVLKDPKSIFDDNSRPLNVIALFFILIVSVEHKIHFLIIWPCMNIYVLSPVVLR